MLSALQGRLTYANVTATVALFIALGGSSYAALNLPKGSVGTKQLRKDAVTSPKVKAGTLRLSDFRRSQRALLRGPAGPQGERGPQGLQGAQGPQGPSGLAGVERVFNVATPFDSNSPKVASATCPAGKKVIAPLGLASSPSAGIESQVHLTELFVSADLSTVTVRAAEDQDDTALNWFITPGAVCGVVEP